MLRSQTARRVLREMLGRKSVSILAGAHDAVSARLIEAAGFDGVWASGFGMSLASHCVPDVDLLTMTEHLAMVRCMLSAVKIPVVADCDSGYGSALNVIRLVHDFEAAGVSGICIEDNLFPKRCSLYGAWSRTLVSRGEMVGKIRAAKASQTDPDFVVIARVESFIAGEPMQAAIDRVAAYEDAGADAILVHAPKFEMLLEFLAQSSVSKPMVVVPTLFPEVHLKHLDAAGYRIAIYANQAVRMAVRAMRLGLQKLKAAEACADVDDVLESLGDIAKLAGLSNYQMADEEYAERSSAAGSNRV